MRVSFVTPELRRLDALKSNALCLCLHEDDWPLRGAPGLVDWRLSGELSRLAERGFVTCRKGEVTLTPLDGRLPFERLLLVGLGPRPPEGQRDELAEGLHLMFETLLKLRVYAAVVHLPGRGLGLSPEETMELLLEVSREHPDHDELVLVEPAEALRAMRAVLDGAH